MAQVDWLTRLLESRKKERRLVLGAMSGTSVDAIDVAVCELSGAGVTGAARPARAKLLHLHSHQYPSDLRSAIISIASSGVQSVAELDVRIGAVFAEACDEAIRSAGFSRGDIDLVGSHGQTVYHHSSRKGAIKASLQLGDGDQIAEALRIPVFFDFRARDVAAGGEGAPLTPYADLVLYGMTHARRAVLNLGGIGNVTVLSEDPSKVVGFDTGPANAPLDRIARALTKGALSHDADGKLARAGTINKTLLEKLLTEDAYLSKAPPKSTGFEMYGDDFVEYVRGLHGRLDNDLLSTVTEFVARSIGSAMERFVRPIAPIDELVVAGGGGRNPYLLERIQSAIAPVKLLQSDEVGVPSAAREAMAFAVFANEALMGVPSALPSVTGASRPCILGKLALP